MHNNEYILMTKKHMEMWASRTRKLKPQWEMTTHWADEDQNFQCGWEYGAHEISYTAGLSLNLHNRFVQSNDPANPFSNISPAEMSTHVLQTIGTRMFTAPIFSEVPNRKQSKCLSIVQWINKWWYIHTMEYYTAL